MALAQSPVPPKKAMIKSVEKERIAVNRMENVFDFFSFTFSHPPPLLAVNVGSAFTIQSVLERALASEREGENGGK